MIGRMMACGTSSSAAMVNSVANQSPTRLEMRLMVCFIRVPFSVVSWPVGHPADQDGGA